MIPAILFATSSCDIFGIVCIVIVLSPSYTMWMGQLVLRKWSLGFKGEFINNLKDLHTSLRLATAKIPKSKIPLRQEKQTTQSQKVTYHFKSSHLQAQMRSIWQESVWVRFPPCSPPDSSLRLTETSLPDISSTSHRCFRPFHSLLFS